MREELALFRGPEMQTNCIKCHQNVQHLDGAPVLARGEQLFVELGCQGCHLAEGYEDLAKVDGITAVGPSLRRIAAKDDPAWMVQLDHQSARHPAAHAHAELHVHAGAGGRRSRRGCSTSRGRRARSGSPAIRTRTSSGMPRRRSRGGS